MCANTKLQPGKKNEEKKTLHPTYGVHFAQ